MQPDRRATVFGTRIRAFVSQNLSARHACCRTNFLQHRPQELLLRRPRLPVEVHLRDLLRQTSSTLKAEPTQSSPFATNFLHCSTCCATDTNHARDRTQSLLLTFCIQILGGTCYSCALSLTVCRPNTLALTRLGASHRPSKPTPTFIASGQLSRHLTHAARLIKADLQLAQ